MVSAGGMGRAKAEIVPALVTLAVRCHCSVMASPDHDVSRRGGDVGPHRYLEDQTDHSLFFCHLSSSVAKHYSHASWSLRSPCGTCCFAPNICSSLQELWAAVITRRARPARVLSAWQSLETVRLWAIATTASTASSSLSV